MKPKDLAARGYVCVNGVWISPNALLALERIAKREEKASASSQA